MSFDFQNMDGGTHEGVDQWKKGHEHHESAHFGSAEVLGDKRCGRKKDGTQEKAAKNVQKEDRSQESRFTPSVILNDERTAGKKRERLDGSDRSEQGHEETEVVGCEDSGKNDVHAKANHSFTDATESLPGETCHDTLSKGHFFDHGH